MPSTAQSHSCAADARQGDRLGQAAPAAARQPAAGDPFRPLLDERYLIHEHAGQLEQALLRMCKRAHEAGTP